MVKDMAHVKNKQNSKRKGTYLTDGPRTLRYEFNQ